MSKETAAVKAAWALIENSTSPTLTPEMYFALRDAIAALPDADDSDTALRWTKKIPTVVGKYWLLHTDGINKSIIDVHTHDMGRYFCYGDFQHDTKRLKGYKFAGPIPEPAAIAAEGGDDER